MNFWLLMVDTSGWPAHWLERHCSGSLLRRWFLDDAADELHLLERGGRHVFDDVEKTERRELAAALQQEGERARWLVALVIADDLVEQHHHVVAAPHRPRVGLRGGR